MNKDNTHDAPQSPGTIPPPLLHEQQQGFFDKSPFLHSLLIFLLAFAFFLFFYSRSIRTDTLELNTLSSSQIITPITFAFEDEEATLLKQQQAIQSIGKIYRLIPSEIDLKRQELHEAIQSGSLLPLDQMIGQEKAMNEAVIALETALMSLRLTDERTIQLLAQHNLLTPHYLPYSPSPLFKEHRLPSFVWLEIQSEALPSTYFLPFISQSLIDFFQSKHWSVEEDRESQQKLRNALQLQVPIQITRVTEGTRLIGKGEKVSSRHLAMLHSMTKELQARHKMIRPFSIIGTFLLTFLFTLGTYLYLRITYAHVLRSNRQFFLLISIVLMTLAMMKGAEFLILHSSGPLIGTIRYPVLIPFASMLICYLIQPGTATFISCVLAIAAASALVFDWKEFLLVNLTASLSSILYIRFLKHRDDIFYICLKSWGYAVLMLLAFNFYHNHTSAYGFITDVASLSFFMLLVTILVAGFLPLLETGFHIITDATLIEYMDPNQELLRRLALEAPGTYQHSIVVGNLAEQAALAIGANGLFCRAATLYHDVGKMITSQYFTENQDGEINIHQLLTPQESAQVIMAHVSEGVALAREADLPESIIDIIKEHHGTTLVYYFYRKQLDAVGGNPSLVNESLFRYAGPKPRSKESGIIMITDSFEAASRSLDRSDERSLILLAERIVKEKIDDGQFDHCLLTFNDLTRIKQALVSTWLAAHHARVRYPNPP